MQAISTVAEPGTQLRGNVFRTDAMPLGSIVAVTETIAGETSRLRNGNLRPTWTSAEDFTTTVQKDAEHDRGRSWWDLGTDD